MMYEPLYSPTEGGCYGFRCKVRVNADGRVSANGAVCNKVVRTQRGIIAHCRLVHNIKQQIVMEDLIKEAKTIDEIVEVARNENNKAATQHESESVRDKSSCSDENRRQLFFAKLSSKNNRRAEQLLFARLSKEQ